MQRASRITGLRGLTRLEFSVIAAIMAVVAGSLLSALLYYEELGEKTEVQLTILNVRAGLRYQVSDRMMNGRMNELRELGDANPIAWLQQAPPGYAGELRSSEAESLPRGSWYFDAEARELRYSPRLRNFLASDSRWLRWRVVKLASAGRSDRIESLALNEVEPIPWF
jgi:general secretion pathway protein G